MGRILAWVSRTAEITGVCVFNCLRWPFTYNPSALASGVAGIVDNSTQQVVFYFPFSTATDQLPNQNGNILLS